MSQPDRITSSESSPHATTLGELQRSLESYFDCHAQGTEPAIDNSSVLSTSEYLYRASVAAFTAYAPYSADSLQAADLGYYHPLFGDMSAPSSSSHWPPTNPVVRQHKSAIDSASTTSSPLPASDSEVTAARISGFSGPTTGPSPYSSAQSTVSTMSDRPMAPAQAGASNSFAYALTSDAPWLGYAHKAPDATTAMSALFPDLERQTSLLPEPTSASQSDSISFWGPSDFPSLDQASRFTAFPGPELNWASSSQSSTPYLPTTPSEDFKTRPTEPVARKASSSGSVGLTDQAIVKQSRQLACTFCRARKLKCITDELDGPCRQCLRRGLTDCDNYEQLKSPATETSKSRKRKSSSSNLEATESPSTVPQKVTSAKSSRKGKGKDSDAEQLVKQPVGLSHLGSNRVLLVKATDAPLSHQSTTSSHRLSWGDDWWQRGLSLFGSEEQSLRIIYRLLDLVQSEAGIEMFIHLPSLRGGLQSLEKRQQIHPGLLFACLAAVVRRLPQISTDASDKGTLSLAQSSEHLVQPLRRLARQYIDASMANPDRFFDVGAAQASAVLAVTDTTQKETESLMWQVETLLNRVDVLKEVGVKLSEVDLPKVGDDLWYQPTSRPLSTPEDEIRAEILVRLANAHGAVIARKCLMKPDQDAPLRFPVYVYQIRPMGYWEPSKLSYPLTPLQANSGHLARGANLMAKNFAMLAALPRLPNSAAEPEIHRILLNMDKLEDLFRWLRDRTAQEVGDIMPYPAQDMMMKSQMFIRMSLWRRTGLCSSINCRPGLRPDGSILPTFDWWVVSFSQQISRLESNAHSYFANPGAAVIPDEEVEGALRELRIGIQMLKILRPLHEHLRRLLRAALSTLQVQVNLRPASQIGDSVPLSRFIDQVRSELLACGGPPAPSPPRQQLQPPQRPQQPVTAPSQPAAAVRAPDGSHRRTQSSTMPPPIGGPYSHNTASSLTAFAPRREPSSSASPQVSAPHSTSSERGGPGTASTMLRPVSSSLTSSLWSQLEEFEANWDQNGGSI